LWNEEGSIDTTSGLVVRNASAGTSATSNAASRNSVRAWLTVDEAFILSDWRYIKCDV
jgi:hypothetical protein